MMKNAERMKHELAMIQLLENYAKEQGITANDFIRLAVSIGTSSIVSFIKAIIGDNKKKQETIEKMKNFIQEEVFNNDDEAIH